MAFAALLGACQNNPSQSPQQTEPELPDDELALEDPWVRPASRGDSTTLYLTIANGRSSADTLLGARAPLFDEANLRAPASGSGEMSRTTSLSLPARTRTTLSPDSVHVVLTNLNQPLKEGGTLLVTLEFAQSGLQRVQAPVRTSAPSGQQ